MSQVSRRTFLSTTAAGAGLTIVPRRVLGRGFQAPSDTVNIATVGFGGMGGGNTRRLMTQNIVAICDVDDVLVDAQLKRMTEDAASATPAASTPQPISKAQAAANARRPPVDNQAALRRFTSEQLPRLKRYRDYRELLDRQKDLDAIVVATPDHMHALIALAAMDLGKHVYVQKPLCWSVEEARALARKAKAMPRVVTQMGNQGHSSDGSRTGYEYIRGGAIGDVREVHVWTNRPYGYWPQGIPRPAPIQPETGPRPLRYPSARATALTADALYREAGPVPSTLSWDLFLGGAPMVEYNPLYHPRNWRGWVDWGQGAIGDMGAHLIDHPFRSLDLGMPTVIETVSTPFNGACYPTASMTHYQFAARGSMPAVKLTWYDGGLTPRRPEELGDEMLNGEGGIIYVGTKGKMIQLTYGHEPRLLPKSLHEKTGEPKALLPRVAHGQDEHEMNWVEAIQGKAQISCPFEYAARLTEVMLLGVVSLRAGQKTPGDSRIHYDAANMRVTNTIKGPNGIVTDPNEFLRREYRAPWRLA
ncbi:NADH-dependent dehydrogenase [Luteitalea sp. TBR-22]|uniref:Gfo/Idh/MocA family protein n=1 Tax=Luteitalea sp. TBR-22 TaxID=2802971 RepID=UPI001AF1135B|nr:Gfo/Idh/MocA family oxidoreductase [Luteitalea sp. TBR-22]BCS35064.1 NADH-dependent dehydrogenase [Luteitalea sp. TBR-22]